MSLVYIEMCSASVVFNNLPDCLRVIVPSNLVGGGGQSESEDLSGASFVRDDIPDTLMSGGVIRKTDFTLFLFSSPHIGIC